MKSHERDHYELAKRIYIDAFARCVVTNPDLRDLRTIKSRIEEEGLSFLTITLPTFGKEFERSLADGWIDSTTFRSFKKVGSIPAFLQGMISLVFDRVTGRILNEENINISAIEAIRQIAYSFKKLETKCTPERVATSLFNFVNTERDLSLANVSESDVAYFEEVATCLWFDLRDIDITQLVPKHGPGAVAEHIEGNQKYVWQLWHERLEPYFPLLETAYPISSYQTKAFRNVQIVTEDREPPVRVVTVPKTMKGPRIIAIEPCCMQYAQQAIKEELHAFLESYRYTSGHVNFTDQGTNRMLAMKSSLDRSLATLDLSEASDRVLHSLAISMFRHNPDLQSAIEACRSTHAELFDGFIIGPLKKFASMGSALCFPVESMYFYTLCIAARLKMHDLPVTSRNVYKMSREVYVYGDDIIVPTDEATFVVDYLQRYHCKVNMSKSYWSGNFRESCGMDAYLGTEVTPTYVRKERPHNKRQASEIISWVKTAQLFEQRGYVETSEYMFSVCQKILGIFPDISSESPALGRIRPRVSGTLRRNRKLQRLEVKAWVAEPVYRADRLHGYGALMKFFLNSARKVDDNGRLGEIWDFHLQRPSSDGGKISDALMPIKARDKLTFRCQENDAVEDHLQRSARHGAVALKCRWVEAV